MNLRPSFLILLLFAFSLPFDRFGFFIGTTFIQPSQLLALSFIIISGLTRIYTRIYADKSLEVRPPIWRSNLITLISLLFFLFINLLSLLQAQYPSRSLEVFLYTAFVIIFALFLSYFLRNYENVRTYEKLHITTYHNISQHITIFILAAATFVSLFGLFQFFGDIFGLSSSLTLLDPNYQKEILGFPRIQSTFKEPIYFANFLLIPLSLLISILICRRDNTNGQSPSNNTNIRVIRGARLLEPLSVILLFLFFFNFLFTVSRGGWLGFLTSLAVLGLFYRKRFIRVYQGLARFSRIIIVASLILILAGIVFSPIGQHLVQSFGGAAYTERAETFSLAWRAFKENPLLGLGPGGFGPYAAGRLYWSPPEGWKIVNNLYLELLAEVGIIGFLVFIAFLGLLILKVYDTNIRMGTNDTNTKAISIGFFAALVGMLVQYNTFSVLYLMPFWFVIGMLLGFVRLKVRKVEGS